MLKNALGILLILVGSISGITLSFIYFLFTELPKRDGLLLPIVATVVLAVVGMGILRVGSKNPVEYDGGTGGIEIFDSSVD